MIDLRMIAIMVVVFIAGALVGVLLISMCFSNERYDNSQAMYDAGYEQGKRDGADEAELQFIENMQETCSHCSYKGAMR